MANVFHDVHGHNVHLSANNTAATRVDKTDNSNGVVFSSRPLRNGETFEVQLDGESEHVLRSGLEIGITDLDPVTLRSSMPRTATDLHTGLTVMVSGQKIAANGRQVDTIKRNVYDLQVGEKISLHLDGNSVTLLMDGETIVRVNVTRWPQVYAVVELYGKAETISVTSNIMASQVSSEEPEQVLFPTSPPSSPIMEEDLSAKVRPNLEVEASAKVEDQTTVEKDLLGSLTQQSAIEERESEIGDENSPGIKVTSTGNEEKYPEMEPKSPNFEESSSTTSPSTKGTYYPAMPAYKTGAPELHLEEIKMEIEAMIKNMQIRNRDDLGPNVDNVYKYSFKFMERIEWRKQAACYMVHLKAGHVMASFFKQLQEWGLNNSLHFKVYIRLRDICLNYTVDSDEVSTQLGEAGLLKVWTEELKCLYSTYRDSKMTTKMVTTTLGIVHNCAKVEVNCALLRRYDFVEIAQPYTDTSHNIEEIVLRAVVSISFVMEENETSIARMRQGTMSTMMNRLQVALQNDQHLSKGWYAYEICAGLANLAAEHHNLMLAVELRAPGLFAMLLMLANDDHERRVALNALDAHVCRESCQVLAKHDLVLPVLENTKQGANCPDVREKAAQVHQRLTQLIEDTKALESTAEGGQGGMVQQVTDHVRGGMGELARNPSSAVLSCPYHRLCTAFFLSLELNGDFFNPAYDMCYCEKCHSERKDRDYYQRGDPPKLYGLPLGWCRFALFLPSRAEALGVSEKWHRAYHGTRHKSLEKILQVGELAMPGREIVGGQRIRELPGHFCENYKPEGFDTKNVFLSPSIRYAGQSAYSKPAKWRCNFQTYFTRVAFQVFISPGSYQVGPETIGAKRQLDKKFSNSEIEWFTNQQGSTILYGLLVKVDDESS